MIVLVWDDVFGSFSKKRAVEVITQSQLEAMKLKGIIRTGDESTASSSSSNIITKSTDNISSDGNVLQHIQIAESHNDRMSVAEDPFTRVVELGDGDIETTEYYIENERMKITNNFKADDLYCNWHKNDGIDPIPNLQSDFYKFTARAKDGIFRLYDPPSDPLMFFENMSSFENWVIIPDYVYKQDEGLSSQFEVLYDSSKNLNSIKSKIGLRVREFSAFHYEHPENTGLRSIRNGGVREYVELFDNEHKPITLYRFDIRAATCLYFPDMLIDGREKRKKRPRFYVTYCRLSCNQNHRFDNHRFVLISILTTLCVAPYNIYLVWDNYRCCVIEWKDANFLKFFWCDLSYPMNEFEYKFLECRLYEFFRNNLYLYDYSRRIPRDYHDVGENIYTCYLKFH